MSDKEFEQQQQDDSLFENNEQLQESQTQEIESAIPESEHAEQPQPDEITSTAKKFGHLSKEEWEAQGRDPSKWKSPESFVKYGNEYSEVKDILKSLRQELKAKDNQIDELVTYHKKSAEQAVKQAREELEARLKYAKDSGDLAAVERLAEQKVVMDFQQRQEEEIRRAKEMQQVDLSFLERNKHWFNDSRPDLKLKAQSIAQEIAKFYPNLTYSEIANRTEARMKFENPEIDLDRTKTAPPISASRSAVNKTVASSAAHTSESKLYSSLTEEQKAEFETIKNIVEKANNPRYQISPYGKPKPITYTVKEYLDKGRK